MGLALEIRSRGIMHWSMATGVYRYFHPRFDDVDTR